MTGATPLASRDDARFQGRQIIVGPIKRKFPRPNCLGGFFGITCSACGRPGRGFKINARCMVEKANPVEMRKALEVVQGLKAGGILFVPIPVIGEKDKDELLGELDRRLGMILQQVE